MIPRRATAAWAAGVLLLAAGCSSDDHVRSYTVPKSTENAPSAAASSAPSGNELAWKTPEGWGSKPPASMRLASFTVPLTDGSEGDCSIIVLGGEGGGLVGNVNRWRGQVGLPAASAADITNDGRKERGTQGEFRFYRIVNPETPDRAFLVSIQPFPGRTAFVKLIAPSASLESLEPAFLELCRSLGPAGA